MQTALADVRTEQQSVTTELDVQTHAIGRVEGAVATLPESLKQLCPAPQRAEAQCKEPEIQRVMISGSKMVVGDIEQVWIDPPGIPLNARIDTTAANNALLGDQIVEFERDGKSWVRFVLHSPELDEPVSLERRVSRHVRTVQSGGGEGVKRPVVRMRLKLGDVQDTFWFVLTDRADHAVILGRSFLKDIALVEVGARYVQPRVKALATEGDKPVTMTQRGPFLFLVLLLVVAGLTSAFFRHVKFNIPFLPGTQETVWQIETKINFWGDGVPVQAILSLPSNQADYRIVNENTVSSGYGFVIEESDGQRRARWSKRDVTGEQTLYYKVELVADPNQIRNAEPEPTVASVRLDEPYATAAQAIVSAVGPRSADALTLAQQLIREMTVVPHDQNVALLLDRFALPTLFSDLLALSNVPARRVEALILEEGRRRQSLVELVQVWQDGQWHLFNPLTGLITNTSDLLLWQTDTPSVLDVIGGKRSRISFAIISQTRPSLSLATSGAQGMDAPSLSLYSLPVEEQNMFKLIMLLPIGALVVVVLRTLVGLKTSGTFMPVLIALAFLQTQLVPGVISFLMVVVVGLFIRNYLSTLNLLLVARIATLVIVVVAIMSIVSVLSYRLGLEAGLTITFFPMIILAWTIERMSILWEEDGPKEVLIQGGGSLFVAVTAFLVMDQPLTRHLAFNFPELHLVVLALILLLGRYTGYRLLELRRFSTMMGND